MTPEYQQSLKEVLKLVLNPFLSGEFSIEVVKESDQWRVILETEQKDILLDDNAELLKAVQHFTRVVIHKKYPGDRTHFLVDIGRYRLDREISIKARINEIARKEVLEKGMTVILVNLTSYERRLIHNILHEIGGLETTSVGNEPSRKLIVRPTSETGSIGMDNAKVVHLFESTTRNID